MCFLLKLHKIILSRFSYELSNFSIKGLIILLLFGAKRLPDLAKGLGKGIKEFKSAVETGKKEILDAKENLDSVDKKDKN